MKINKEIKAKAASLFESVKEDVLYVNKKGHFFTSKNLAENSVKNKKDIAEIRRSDVLAEAKKEEDKFVCPSIDELKAKQNLEEYLGNRKRGELTDIAELVGYEIKGNISNKDLVSGLISEINKEA